MTMPPVPADGGRRRLHLWLARCAGVVGGLVLATNLVAYAAATFPTVIDHRRSYEWRSGSSIYLANAERHATICEFDADGDQVTAVSLPPEVPAKVVGARISRPVRGPVTVTCNGQVHPSSGLITYLYPAARWGEPVLLAASFLIVYGWQVGRRRPHGWVRRPVIPGPRMPTRRRRR
jgi:hypothetical protein